jgi:hypothetical protein
MLPSPAAAAAAPVLDSILLPHFKLLTAIASTRDSSLLDLSSAIAAPSSPAAAADRHVAITNLMSRVSCLIASALVFWVPSLGLTVLIVASSA